MKTRAFRVHYAAQLPKIIGILQALKVDEEHPFLIEVSDYKGHRTSAQNKLLHAILRDVAENIEVDGQRFSPDAWKERFRRDYIGTEEFTLPPTKAHPEGELYERGISTTTLDVAGMGEAIDRFSAWLANEFGYLAEVG